MKESNSEESESSKESKDKVGVPDEENIEDNAMAIGMGLGLDDLDY